MRVLKGFLRGSGQYCIQLFKPNRFIRLIILALHTMPPQISIRKLLAPTSKTHTSTRIIYGLLDEHITYRFFFSHALCLHDRRSRMPSDPITLSQAISSVKEIPT